MDWEFGVSWCKLLHLGWMGNEVLLYSAGNYIQSIGREYNGGWHKKKNVYIFIYICYDWVTLLYNRNWRNIVNWWDLLINPGGKVSGSAELRKKRQRNRVGIRELLPLRGNSNPLSQVMIFICYFLLPCMYRITCAIYNVIDQGYRYVRHRPFVFIDAIND